MTPRHSGRRSTWCQGSPILMPIALASGERAITHPSLFDRTTSGRPARAGSKARSAEQ